MLRFPSIEANRNLELMALKLKKKGLIYKEDEDQVLRLPIEINKNDFIWELFNQTFINLYKNTEENNELAHVKSKDTSRPFIKSTPVMFRLKSARN